MELRLVISVWLLMISLNLSAQEQNDSVRMKSAFIELGVGSGNIKFRDFATSPLIYSGVPISVDLNVRQLRVKYQNEFGVKYSFGMPKTTVAYSGAQSSIQFYTIYFRHLRKINRWSNEKLSFDLGGELNFAGSSRFNPSLQNNSVGQEFINTLFFATKITIDLSRSKAKNKKVWFVKYNLKPRDKNLSFRLNIGVINNNYRNGYAYIDQSSVLNDPQYFGGYQYQWFHGFRLNSALDYTISLRNKNAIQISYLWDGCQTGGNTNRFEFGSHILRFALLFKTK